MAKSDPEGQAVYQWKLKGEALIVAGNSADALDAMKGLEEHLKASAGDYMEQHPEIASMRTGLAERGLRYAMSKTALENMAKQQDLFASAA